MKPVAVGTLLLLLAASACGGSSSPAAPTASSSTPTPAPSDPTPPPSDPTPPPPDPTPPPPDPSLSPADQKAIARQIAAVTMQALRGGVTISRATSSFAVMSQTSGSFTVECASGGQVNVGPLPPFIGQSGSVGVTGVTEEWGACAWEDAAWYTASGSLTLSGNYQPFYTRQTLGVTGTLTTTPGGSTPVEGTVSGVGEFIGTIGGDSVIVMGTGLTNPDDLKGRYDARAPFTDNVFGCTGTASIVLDFSSVDPASGTLSFTVTDDVSGPDPICSRDWPRGPIGATGTGNLTGSLRDGEVNLTSMGTGLLINITGTYEPGGTYMGGRYNGTFQGFVLTGSWGARKID